METLIFFHRCPNSSVLSNIFLKKGGGVASGEKTHAQESGRKGSNPALGAHLNPSQSALGPQTSPRVTTLGELTVRASQYTDTRESQQRGKVRGESLGSGGLHLPA